jgi:hypothetical protein
MMTTATITNALTRPIARPPQVSFAAGANRTTASTADFLSTQEQMAGGNTSANDRTIAPDGNSKRQTTKMCLYLDVYIPGFVLCEKDRDFAIGALLSTGGGGTAFMGTAICCELLERNNSTSTIVVKQIRKYNKQHLLSSL